MKNQLKLLLICLSFALTALTGIPAQAFEKNIARPGGVDLGNFESSNPGDCQRRCQDNPRCIAFTWARPGTRHKSPACFLKGAASTSRVPPRDNNCCISGLVQSRDRQWSDKLPAGPPEDFVGWNFHPPIDPTLHRPGCHWADTSILGMGGGDWFCVCYDERLDKTYNAPDSKCGRKPPGF